MMSVRFCSEACENANAQATTSSPASNDGTDRFSIVGRFILGTTHSTTKTQGTGQLQQSTTVKICSCMWFEQADTRSLSHELRRITQLQSNQHSGFNMASTTGRIGRCYEKARFFTSTLLSSGARTAIAQEVRYDLEIQVGADHRRAGDKR